jgi:PIN domain nuclease of toxin-antitoxin system
VRYLLDTHIVVWWCAGDPSLDAAHQKLLDELMQLREAVGISGITLWEIAMLGERGRLQIAGSLDRFLHALEAHPGIRVLPLSAPIVLDSVRLGPSFPRDPADRVIVASARIHGLRLLTADRAIRASGAVPVA